MIYKKKRSEVQGLWCRKNKKFYYLETGVHSIRNPLDRIKSSLVTRELLEWNINGTRRHEEPEVKMSWAEAEERGYEVECIYLNPHVKAQIEDLKSDKPTSVNNPWK